MNPLEKHKTLLFGEDMTFVILDGASIPGLLTKLYELQPEHVCLYRGELEPDLAEVAPYLVNVIADSEFSDWLMKDGWGQHWGIWGTSRANLQSLHQHFRRLMIVQSPEGEPLYFRFYDPRVLRTFLPTCEGEELQQMFGAGVESFRMEGDEPGEVVRFKYVDGALVRTAEALV